MRIEFGNLSIKLLIPLFYPFLNLVRKKNDDIYPVPTSNLYYAFMMSLSYLFGGVVYLYVSYRSRKTQNISSTIEIDAPLSGKPNAFQEVKEDVNKTAKQRKNDKYNSLFLLALINTVPTIAEIFGLNSPPPEKFEQDILMLSVIIFFTLYSVLFLNSKIYKHQIFSLIITFTCLIISLILDYNSFSFSRLGSALIYYVIEIGYYALYDVLVKKHFETHLTDPYYLMFFVGLFCFILVIPLDIFVFFYDNEGNISGLEIIKYIKSIYGPKFFLYFSHDLITGFLWLLSVILTLYYFSPCHYILSKTLSEIISLVQRQLEKGGYNLYKIMVYVILYGVIFFSSLIYNEVIIIHAWSLEKNTFKYITLRQQIELDEAEKIKKKYEENRSKKGISMCSSSFDEYIDDM